MGRTKGTKVARRYRRTSGPFELRELAIEMRLPGVDRDAQDTIWRCLRDIRANKWGQWAPQIEIDGDRVLAYWSYRATPVNAYIFQRRASVSMLAAVDAVMPESVVDAADLHWAEVA